jgi:hypothetical protein
MAVLAASLLTHRDPAEALTFKHIHDVLSQEEL